MEPLRLFFGMEKSFCSPSDGIWKRVTFTDGLRKIWSLYPVLKKTHSMFAQRPFRFLLLYLVEPGRRGVYHNVWFSPIVWRNILRTCVSLRHRMVAGLITSDCSEIGHDHYWTAWIRHKQPPPCKPSDLPLHPCLHMEHTAGGLTWYVTWAWPSSQQRR